MKPMYNNKKATITNERLTYWPNLQPSYAGNARNLSDWGTC